MFGCDEAGRGPVLGSMFVACVAGDNAAIPGDVQDSKNLSYATIAKLADEIRAATSLSTAVVEVTATEIDEGESMTQVSARAYAQAIDEAVEDNTHQTGVIDAFTQTEDTAADKVHTACDTTVELTAEHGADTTYDHVSAASILAKDARETHMEAVAETYGDVGSGYPSDPTTREFLEEFVNDAGELPACARVSWKTSQDILES